MNFFIAIAGLVVGLGTLALSFHRSDTREPRKSKYVDEDIVTLTPKAIVLPIAVASALAVVLSLIPSNIFSNRMTPPVIAIPSQSVTRTASPGSTESSISLQAREPLPTGWQSATEASSGDQVWVIDVNSCSRSAEAVFDIPNGYQWGLSAQINDGPAQEVYLVTRSPDSDEPSKTLLKVGNAALVAVASQPAGGYPVFVSVEDENGPCIVPQTSQVVIFGATATR